MMVVKRKQIIVVSLVAMVMIAGYLNWSYQKGKGGDETAKTNVSKNFGEAKLVDNKKEDVVIPGVTAQPGKATPAPSKAPADKKTNAGANVKESDAKVTESAPQFIADAKKNKEDARSESIALLESMINNPNSDTDGKQKAQNLMIGIAKNNDTEMIVENLVKAKGIKNCVAYIHDGGINIAVQGQKLTSQQVAQIQSIVNSEAKITTDKIKIIEVQ